MESLQLSSFLVDNCRNLSYSTPTEIQSACIPYILNGKDVIASAKTGSGKTAAFALPILHSLSRDPFGIFALVLTPTRELAFQIADQFKAFSSSNFNLKLSVVVGGMDMMAQSILLNSRPHIVVATPGRLCDHLNSNHELLQNFKGLKFLVLDEADRLLSESFTSELDHLLTLLPKTRQTLLFSATMTPDIESLQFNASSPPIVYQGSTRYDTVDKLDQRYLFLPYTVKDCYLAHLLRVDFGIVSLGKDVATTNKFNRGGVGSKKTEKSVIKGKYRKKIDQEVEEKKEEKTVIIFTGKWKTCERVYLVLRELGIRCTALHSRLSQPERLASIAKFKSGIVPVLITTDVGSRGLDIPKVQVVINYDLPSDATDYVHRIGRTARAGRGGVAVSIVCERDVDVLLNIESKIEKKLLEYEGVVENKVLESLDEVSVARKIADSTLMDLTKSKYSRALRKMNNF